YHLFRPMLYQVATGLLTAEEISAPIRSILHAQKNVDVLLGEVSGVDTAHKRVLMGQESLPYDFLILATGIHYNYFGHDGWMGIAPSLSTAEDAAHIRSRIFSAFEAAERLTADAQADDAEAQADSEVLAGWMTFALVGAGATGVEMAGAMAELTRKSLANNFRHIDPTQARILLFEAGPRILAAFPEDLAARARRRLEQLGVTVNTGAKVESVAADGVTVNGEKIPCRTIIWAAGVTASSAGRWLGTAMDRSGRVQVNPDLSVPGLSDVFVIGDTAAVVAPWRNILGKRSGEPMTMPGVAQPAMQEGRYVASLIRRRVRGLRPPEPFCYRDKGDLAIVGRAFAVANLKVARFWGLFAWLLWLGVHIFYLIGFANRLLVLIRWAFSFAVNQREARLFTPEMKPQSERAAVPYEA
ncbi:MAG: NAD(P)/FAD-dependent oxidoreductase, partial [Armatimonadota bacterium]|nr:NAD(P)/FAD-dependent oxidoreductase [Armatimonadota bacterium]